MCVRAAIWDGCRVEWLGGGRPQRMRLAVVKKCEGARLEVERRRLTVEDAGVDVGGRSVEAVEADRISLDVEVAVESRTAGFFEVLEATVGGRTVELNEGDELSRLMDAVEADRISLDIEVAEVTVEARTVEGLEVEAAVLARIEVACRVEEDLDWGADDS